MLKKLFKFGKKNQQEVQIDEVVKDIVSDEDEMLEEDVFEDEDEE